MLPPIIDITIMLCIYPEEKYDLTDKTPIFKIIVDYNFSENYNLLHLKIKFKPLC